MSPTFDAGLFGVPAAQFRELALALVTPTLGFVFVFVLARPLKKLPFIEVADDYVPPTWVVPIFACGSLSIMTFCFTTAFCLSLLSGNPAVNDFMTQYHRNIPLDIPSGRLTSALITIDDYDGYSSFRIFVNGYRVFSSTSHCRLLFQCRPYSQDLARHFNEFRRLSVNYKTIHHLEDSFSIPHSEDIGNLLIAGKNTIDFQAVNSGVATCRLTISLKINSDFQRTIAITPDPWKPIKIDPAAIVQEFDTGTNAGEGDEIPVYRTNNRNQSYRLCERIRLEFTLNSNQLEGLRDGDVGLRNWLVERINKLNMP